MNTDQMKELAARLRQASGDIGQYGLVPTANLDAAADLIERMAQAEPVATVYYPRTGGNAGLSWTAIPETGVMPPEGAKLYLAPPARARHVALVCPQCNWTLEEREPLSEEQIMDLVRDDCGVMRWPSTALDIARAIEQAHGIGSEK